MNFLKWLTGIIDYVNQFIKKCNKYRKKEMEYFHWLKIECLLALKKFDTRKAWKWAKKRIPKKK